MTLALRPRRVIESADRRVIAAFQLVDAATDLPIIVPASVAAPRVVIAGNPAEIVLPDGAVRILQNRSGTYVLLRAPFFDTYTSTFDNPPAPPETAGGPLMLRLSITDAGPQYLPRQFQLAVPRSLDPNAAGGVFEPEVVRLFRAPGASAQEGWTVLRVRVTEAGVDPPNTLPGVLVRVYRGPRGNNDQPIAMGMTDWRGRVRGEALLPLTAIQRFRPGDGPNVIERDQRIDFDVVRDSGFTGAAGQLPDVARMIAGVGGGLIQASTRPPNPQLDIVRPATPVRVEAGREYVVHLAMP
jgi:hypothetical protein